MFKKTLLFFLSFSLWVCGVGAENLDKSARLAQLENWLKIGLENVSRAQVQCMQSDNPVFWVSELDSEKVFAFKTVQDFSAQNGRIIVGDEKFSAVRLFSCQSGILSLNGKMVRGNLVLIPKQDRLQVLNEVSLDDYVRGTVPKEVPYTWPSESLKVQAVISRTYALKSLGKHKDQGFDLCNKVHCQVYGMMAAEKETTNRAVEETAGQVLIYDGELAETFFFGNCGGRTEVPSGAWSYNKIIPYLKSVRCKYCRDSKHYSWDAFFSEEHIRDRLTKFDAIKLPIEKIEVHDERSSGRAGSFKVYHEGGVTTVAANAFRLALGSDQFDSTLVESISKKGNGFAFKGRGWGHGVGLCQDGARGMADAGKSYTKILKFYYPGTELLQE